MPTEDEDTGATPRSVDDPLVRLLQELAQSVIVMSERLEGMRGELQRRNDLEEKAAEQRWQMFKDGFAAIGTFYASNAIVKYGSQLMMFLVMISIAISFATYLGVPWREVLGWIPGVDAPAVEAVEVPAPAPEDLAPVETP